MKKNKTFPTVSDLNYIVYITEHMYNQNDLYHVEIIYISFVFRLIYFMLIVVEWVVDDLAVTDGHERCLIDISCTTQYIVEISFIPGLLKCQRCCRYQRRHIIFNSNTWSSSIAHRRHVLYVIRFPSLLGHLNYSRMP